MYEMATSQTLTSHQAAQLLRENAHVRTLQETLARYVHIPAHDTKSLQSHLTDALMAHSPEGTVRGNLERKVRMWMGNDVRSISKQGAVQLAFALGLSVEEAGEFLCRTCGEDFHWREPRDIVYLFALRTGMNYVEAMALERDMAEKGLLRTEGGGGRSATTAMVRKNAQRLESAAELESYLQEAKDQLGSFHNTAYDLFCGYLSLLADPVTWKTSDTEDDSREGTMSVREITDVYLYNKLIPRVKKKTAKNNDAQARALSAIERDVQQNWPDETTLSKMLNRKLDISRKTLILLFLATDGDTMDDVETDNDWTAGFVRNEDLDCADIDARWHDFHEDGFENLYTRMNAMLADCGFAQLDPRVPFDWMILYCMCADETMLIDERVQQFLAELFPGAGSA